MRISKDKRCEKCKHPLVPTSQNFTVPVEGGLMFEVKVYFVWFCYFCKVDYAVEEV